MWKRMGYTKQEIIQMVHKLKSQLWTKNKNPIAICKPLKKS
jgi:hypothetical protein